MQGVSQIKVGKHKTGIVGLKAFITAAQAGLENSRKGKRNDHENFY